MLARATDVRPTERPPAPLARGRASSRSSENDVERGSVSVLSLRFVSKRRRVPVRAPGDGDVIVNGARDVVVDDDERDV